MAITTRSSIKVKEELEVKRDFFIKNIIKKIILKINS